MDYEYQAGIRDKAAIVKKAHEAVKLHGFPSKRGKKIPHLHNPDNYAKFARTKTGKQVPGQQGANHWNWKGGVSKEVWKTPAYQQWRRAVMRRDNFTCVACGDNQGGNLEADHIKPRYLFPELTFDVSNGRTLCKPCHKQTNTYGARVTLLTREDFELAA